MSVLESSCCFRESIVGDCLIDGNIEIDTTSPRYALKLILVETKVNFVQFDS